MTPKQNIEAKTILQDVLLTDLIESSGVHLTHEGPVFIGSCPFHEDTGQSLMVDPETSHWQCDGDCQTGGSVIEWVMNVEHVSHSHAMELLRHDHHITAVAMSGDNKRTTIRHLDTPFDGNVDDQTILSQTVDYYHETLKQSPNALEYLHKRGLNNSEMLDHFKLGFSNRSLGYRLPEKNRKEGAALRGRLQRLGIIKSSGHEYFRGSLIIPVINHGVIEQIYGRKIASKLRPGTPLHLYLPGPLKGIFNLEAVQCSDELILCQSLIDALTFWNAGFRNVTCSYGLEGFTEHYLSTFKQYKTKRVLIAYAGHKLADKAAMGLADNLNALSIENYRIEFPKGLDANAYALQTKLARDCLGDVIRKAAWLGRGKRSCPDSNIEISKECTGAECDAIEETASTDLAIVEQAQVKTSESAEDEDDDPLPASILPPPPIDINAEISEEGIIISLGDRRYRIKGLDTNLSPDQLRVNLLVSKGEDLHVDIFDLYAAKARTNYIRQAAIELGLSEEIIKKDLGRILLKLEILQDDYIQQTLTPKPDRNDLSKKEKAEAMVLLQSPDLMQRILDDYEVCGVVGEKTNKLVGYLAALSRKLDKPLAVMIQSTSAAGKSALMEAVLSFIPDEDKMQYSALTGQSLFYMGGINLKHKILAISEEEGASHAAYALKLLQSEGQLTIASTGKDHNTGRHVTHEYKVEGPVMIFSTTTAIDIDEELLNRCLVLSVDEDRLQTQAIHEHQRFEETLEGLLASQNREDILRVHSNAQRLLKPIKVVNPFAEQLTFLDDKTRTRRDHKKYLTLIRTIALLHQYQREIKTTYYKGKTLPYIEVILDDIEIANQLAHEVLGRSLDELPPQTRRLLILMDSMVLEFSVANRMSRSDYRFTRRDIRLYTGWGETQLKVHLKRLEDMEYLLIHRGGRGRQIIYELLYNSEGQDGNPFLMGLIDIHSLAHERYDDKQSVSNNSQSDSSRPDVGGLSVPCQDEQNTVTDCNNSELTQDKDKKPERACIENRNTESYRKHTASGSEEMHHER